MIKHGLAMIARWLTMWSNYNAVFLSYTEMHGSILITTPLRCCFAADVDAQTQSKNTKSMLSVLGGGRGANYVENLETLKSSLELQSSTHSNQRGGSKRSDIHRFSL